MSDSEELGVWVTPNGEGTTRHNSEWRKIMEDGELEEGSKGRDSKIGMPYI